MNKTYYVYIVTNDSRMLYVGVTSDLEKRVSEHKHKARPGFTARYNVDQLVYYESTFDVHAALAREKQIKAWRREKKMELVRSMNPQWRDLAVAERESERFLPHPAGSE